MKIEWNENGLVIQRIDRINMYCQIDQPYLGVGRYPSWPLQDELDDESKLLTQEADNKWFSFFYYDEKEQYNQELDNKLSSLFNSDDKQRYALEVVPSFEYIKTYYTLCNIKCISIRILCIETDRETPLWQGPRLNRRHLGFDYATSTDFFSALYDDLYAEETHHLLYQYKNKLNSYGLFCKEEDLIQYIEDRKKAILDGYELEPHGDFCAMKICEAILDCHSDGVVDNLGQLP